MLRCNMSDKSFDYIVLSHMWGDRPQDQVQLTLDNITTFQEDIPFHPLSDVYKEAIRATLTLGHKYLWIDSLCIIQDSNSPDWEIEIPRMAIIYGNAICNLSYLFPPSHPSPDMNVTRKPSTDAHCRLRDDPRANNPCILLPATPTSSGLYIHHPTSSFRTKHGMNNNLEPWLTDWPLFSRAWTFQEYLLAPRTLLLGHINLMWQCSRFFYDEIIGPLAGSSAPSGPNQNKSLIRMRGMGKTRYYPISIGRIKDSESPSDTDVLSFVWDWLRCVNEYRDRDLKNKEDRIIAFAGFAKACANLGRLTYLAGLWGEVLSVSLLWYVKAEESVRVDIKETPMSRDEEKTGVKIKEDVASPAPTWSWFSVPIYHSHEISSILDERQIFAREKSMTATQKKKKQTIFFDDIYWAENFSFKFPGFETDHFPKTGFHDFHDFRLTLSLPLLPARISWSIDIQSQIDHIRSNYEIDAEVECDARFNYFPDDPTSSSTKPPMKSLLALLGEFQLCLLGGDGSVQRTYVGLVVMPGTRMDTWKRVGIFKLNVYITHVNVLDVNLQDVAERWKDYVLAGDSWELGSITIE